MRKRILLVPIIVGIAMVVLLILPFIHPLKIYNPIAGVYLYVHGTYAESYDYDTRERISIPSRCLLRPVVETSRRGGLRDSEKVVKEIYIPNSVKKIGPVSFVAFEKLERIEGGENVQIIDSYAFNKCVCLSEIPYFGKVESIEDSAFSDCNLTELHLPRSIRSLGNYAFRWNNISKINIEAKDVELGKLVFADNPFEQELGDFVVDQNGVLQQYNGNDEVIVIPSGVKTIGDSFDSYNNYESLNNIEIYVPDSVTKITDCSFLVYGNEYTVYIPECVTDIEEYDDEKQYVFSNDVKIVTTRGSTAEKFAKQYNLKYKLVDEIAYPDGVETEYAVLPNPIKN